jgi:hypothetical protein
MARSAGWIAPLMTVRKNETMSETTHANANAHATAYDTTF